MVTHDKRTRVWARGWDYGKQVLPGSGLAAALGAGAAVLQAVEERVMGHAVIEALVIAMVLGVLWRNLWGVGPCLRAGSTFTAKTVLEVAIVLLGASVDLPALLQAGPRLLLAILAAVTIGITASIAIGRCIGLNPKLAILVACGNAICGNSAIAAVAPAIHADAEDVASSIALTAVLGVVVVLALPLLIPLLHFTFYQYGVLAGMTVYAVPQVLAATFPVSAISGEIGTLVKLVRVLLLGPVVLFFSVRQGRCVEGEPVSLTRLVPWFVIGFLILSVLRSSGFLPGILAEPLRESSRWLTVVAMAALGLGVDIRSVLTVGWPVSCAVLASLVVLISVSLVLIHVLGIR